MTAHVEGYDRDRAPFAMGGFETKSGTSEDAAETRTGGRAPFTPAMDRAHRIGQDKPVFVHRLIAENTVEAAIQRMQARKQALADALFEGTGQGQRLEFLGKRQGEERAEDVTANGGVAGTEDGPGVEGGLGWHSRKRTSTRCSVQDDLDPQPRVGGRQRTSRDTIGTVRRSPWGGFETKSGTSEDAAETRTR